MTVDEIIVEIRNGNNGLMEQLWFVIRNLIAWYAKRYYSKCFFDRKPSVEVDDLIQIGYFALLDAVKAYDPVKGSFTTTLLLYLRNHFRKAVTKGQKDLLEHCTSLDAPLSADDPDGNRLYDLVSDTVTDGKDYYASCEERIFCEQLHKVLEDALDKLPEKQAFAIRSEFWHKRKLKETADMMGVSINNVRDLRETGLQKIRQSSSRKALESFIELKTDYYHAGKISKHNPFQVRTTEKLVLYREMLREQYADAFEE